MYGADRSSKAAFYYGNTEKKPGETPGRHGVCEKLASLMTRSRLPDIQNQRLSQAAIATNFVGYGIPFPH